MDKRSHKCMRPYTSWVLKSGVKLRPVARVSSLDWLLNWSPKSGSGGDGFSKQRWINNGEMSISQREREREREREMENPDQVVVTIDQENTKNQSPDRSQPKDPTSTPQLLRAITRKQTLRRLSFSKPKSRNVEFSLPSATRLRVHESDELQPLNASYTTTDDSSSEDEDDDEEDLDEDEDMEMVLDGDGHLERAARIGLGHRLSGVHHRAELHAERESAVFRVRAEEELPELCLAGPCSAGLDYHVQRQDSQEEQTSQKGELIVFLALVAVLVGATIWLIKIILVKVLASSFHVSTYFDRMKESVFHHYILDTLSGPPDDDGMVAQRQNHHLLMASKSLPVKLMKMKKSNVLINSKSKRFGSRRLDMEKLRKLSLDRSASAWNVKRLVSYVRSFGLSTISTTVDEFGKAESEITSEWEARTTAKRIFKNVAKPGAKYIEEEDLMRFLNRVEIHTIFHLFEGALETGTIAKSAFKNWVVRAYFERKALAHSLNDTKSAVQQLHKLASAVVSVIIIVISLLVMGLATTKLIFFVVTQVVLVGVMFHNTCKTIFESIIFVFVMHPFDIGDRCVIDGIQVVVEEMNILTTVFLRYDNEKIYYPNSVLITKPISNYYRSPEMGDGIDFTIDFATSMESINALKKAIQIYLESKPKHWNPKHDVIVTAIEDMNKMKMCLCVQHTINHQNYGERCVRMTDLILELKKILGELDIKYNLLPQQILLTQASVGNWRQQLP
ncbi:hypothetical protein RHSIM_Rhsim11G0025700 [Rhododendron simsii]|uniref:Mechanosensitive ion channel MscS domain-containing protein n=1 Tax=Rhododendron simsii TaxID=118357 RepID=A0A834LBZ4_RHOSS|nr:hypothetical protein RHSIM_Rhsim11G0025700 [Rhododendron simsii]